MAPTLRLRMPYLSEEVIWQIFLRLPARPLARCRAVCRAWRVLATDRVLLLEHHRRQRARPLVYFLSSGNPEAKNFRVDALDLRADDLDLRGGDPNAPNNLRGHALDLRGEASKNLRGHALDLRGEASKNLRGGDLDLRGEASKNLRGGDLDLRADDLDLRGHALDLRGEASKNLRADDLDLRGQAFDLCGQALDLRGEASKNFRADAVDLRAVGSQPIIMFTEPTEEDGVEITLEIHGCCAGLLLLSFTDGITCAERLYICNPATHQTAAVPSIGIDVYKIAGLYQHGPTEEYRVLYHRGVGDGKTYEVLCLNSGQRKGIGRPVASEADADAVAWLARGPRPACWEPPVLLHDNLHWPPQLESSNTILVFDTVMEKFRCIPAPVQPGSVSSLFDMDGRLALSSRRNPMEHPTYVDLWLLEDHNTGTWVHCSEFKMKPLEDSILALWWPRGSFLVSLHGDVLVDCAEVLLHCDRNGNLLARIHGRNHFVKFSGFLLKDNLSPQPFFEMNATGSTAGPPFFAQLGSLH